MLEGVQVCERLRRLEGEAGCPCTEIMHEYVKCDLVNAAVHLHNPVAPQHA